MKRKYKQKKRKEEGTEERVRVKMLCTCECDCLIFSRFDTSKTGFKTMLSTLSFAAAYDYMKLVSFLFDSSKS